MMASLISAGPFVSGTTHRLLIQGQLVDAVGGTPGTAADGTPAAAGQKRKLRMSLGEQQQQQRHASEEPSEPNLNPSPAGPTSSTKSKGGSSSPTLADMLAAGLLQAGHDNVTVTYRGVSYSASLQDNGAIAFRGSEFTTPSAFSVYVKRLVSPNKQGDDGWHSCSRCEVWRSVPQSCWAQLDADGKREFFCEEAWWDVAAMEPFTPACISDVHAEASDAP
ncbi:hypothetical protein OEZ86_006115 [Tetradesmus obliquus]|uniref:RAMA domain-containing protein n=1 Tax=Tetradesmus obliquus TaxID=3088 RepID=A0ABY8TWL8_TETOB|nr:hypothetical protein OEZ85_006419 [Tetradesmus obliquus]WIA32949.1 hypothetical protein OEZ86_006115 [Tetradesmus obliquus]